jgi:phenylalanyl-tRNA synthetase beta chain
MITSYKWLQRYFDDKLPSPKDVASAFTFHAFEIEDMHELAGSEKTAGGIDTIFDVKVLPDRNCYALSHRGIARELGAILGLPITERDVKNIPHSADKGVVSKVVVTIENNVDCNRYVARRIEGVSVGPSPKWLIGRLESVGQRSISSIVDATNFIMLDIGQPMHAFDADKVKGGIAVRRAHKGEKMTTLDGKDLTLDDTMLVIADDVGPLALAGIKGGNRAIVDEKTTRIILESANFNPSLTRRTSTRVGIRTDSSKRFENGLSPELAGEAIERITKLIADIHGETGGQKAQALAIGEVTDIYPVVQKNVAISVTVDFINAVLGISIPKADILKILKSLRMEVGESADGALTVTPPLDRLDIVTAEDIVEEVGRMYGYERIESVVPKAPAQPAEINKAFYYAQLLKKTLSEKYGFSEIYTPSILEKGAVEIANPLASDKKALRSDLTQGMVRALETNAYNAPLLGLDQLRIFELGTVFAKDGGEYLSLALGVKNSKKSKIKEKEVIAEVLASLSRDVSSAASSDPALAGISTSDGAVCEVNFSNFVEKLPAPSVKDYKSVHFEHASDSLKYQKFSVFPFIVRDIAVLVSEDTDATVIETIIRDKSGALLKRIDLFDTFVKKDKDATGAEISRTSYAFRMVYQSDEKTLSDAEVATIMQSIYDEVTKRGWVVR